MNRLWTGIALFLTWLLSARAEFPAAPLWLPTETAGFISVAHWANARLTFSNSLVGRTWYEPAMAAFRTNAESCLREHLLSDLPPAVDFDSAKLVALIRGQATVAWYRPPGTASSAAASSSKGPWIALLDAAESAPQMQAFLADLRTRLDKQKIPAATDRIGDREFVVITLPRPAIIPTNKPVSKADARTDPKNAPDHPAQTNSEPRRLWYGLVGSALLVASDRHPIERSLPGLAGTNKASLASRPSLQLAQAAHPADALVRAWLDYQAVSGDVSRRIAGVFSLLSSLGAKPNEVASAMGLDGLQSLSFSLGVSPKGSELRASFEVPETRRTGFFKGLQLLPKDASPPPFVAANAIHFQRWRIDGSQFWKTLEESINRVSPQVLGLFRLTLETMGQAEDPNFSIKRNFQDALGDDLVTFTLPPTDKSQREGPLILVLGSPKPEPLLASIRTLFGLQQLDGDSPAFRQHEFLGHRIHETSIAQSADDPHPTQVFLVATGKQVIISESRAFIESFIKGQEDPAKALGSRRDLLAAAERVGGFTSGFHAWEDEAATGPARWQALRAGNIESIGMLGTYAMSLLGPAVQCLPLELMPEYAAVRNHATVSAASGKTDASGFHFRLFLGNP